MTFTDTSKRPLRCPECERELILEARFCHGCGAGVPEPAPVPAGTDDPWTRCDQCGAPFAEEASFCYACGTACPPPPPARVECPECRREIDGVDPFCRFCGAQARPTRVIPGMEAAPAPEVVVEVEPEVEAEVEAEAEIEAEPEPEPELEAAPEPELEAAPEPELEAAPEPELEAQPELEAAPEPAPPSTEVAPPASEDDYLTVMAPFPAIKKPDPPEASERD